MTKDVLITIAGMHTDAIDKGDLTDGPIEVVTPASYFCKNGKHYISPGRSSPVLLVSPSSDAYRYSRSSPRRLPRV